MCVICVFCQCVWVYVLCVYVCGAKLWSMLENSVISLDSEESVVTVCLLSAPPHFINVEKKSRFEVVILLFCRYLYFYLIYLKFDS